MSYLLASIVWALTAKLPSDVERYFLAQFTYTIFIDAGMRFLGTKSPVYAAIYSVFTILIVVTMFAILDGKVHNFRKATLAWMAGVLVALICYVALPRPIPYYKYIGLVEGLTLTTCGTILIFTARTKVYFSLALLWISLACFRLCYCLQMNNAAWRWMNGWLPAMLCVAAFTYIGATNRGEIP